jgi:hypothetical protein
MSHKAKERICSQINYIINNLTAKDDFILEYLDFIDDEVKSVCGSDYQDINEALNTLYKKMTNRPIILRKIGKIKLRMARIENKDCVGGHSQSLKF